MPPLVMCFTHQARADTSGAEGIGGCNTVTAGQTASLRGPKFALESSLADIVATTTGGIETHTRRLDIPGAHRQRIVARKHRLADCLDGLDTTISN